MSVYIKGMKMPKDGCHHLICVYADGMAATGSRPYKAVPIPPHGRLIDADALMLEFDKARRTMQQHGQEYSYSFMSSSREISTEWYCVEDMVENAPTIIEEEEKEKCL